MRILVAGATGAVGRHLLPRLVAAGHQVVGTTRTEAKAPLIRQLGGEALVADGLDAGAIQDAVQSARPDVIVHEMTDLKAASDLRHFDRAFAVSNRLRTEGTDHLLAAARAAGVKRFVAQSFCGWPYARAGGAVKSEDDPLDPNPPRELRRTLDAIPNRDFVPGRFSDAVLSECATPSPPRRPRNLHQTCRNLQQGTQPPDLISLRAVANQTPVLSRGPPAERSAGRSRDTPRTPRQTSRAASALRTRRQTGGRRARALHLIERAPKHRTTMPDQR
jgi:hypothetical protein